MLRIMEVPTEKMPQGFSKSDFMRFDYYSFFKDRGMR